MTKLPFRSFLSAGKHALDRLRPVGPRSSNVRPGKRDDDGVLLVVGNESAGKIEDAYNQWFLHPHPFK